MPTLHIGSAVSDKTGTVNKGFSFIVMGEVLVQKILAKRFSMEKEPKH